jgi:hypothetical protein
MKTYYTTGRDYGTPQVLEITVPAAPTGAEFDLFDVDFIDRARNISGRVQLFGMQLNSAGLVGRAVLESYDAGLYTQI